MAHRYEQAPLRVAGEHEATAAALVAGAVPPGKPARVEPVTDTGLPGRLTATDRDRLAGLWATGRRYHRWGPVAQLLVRCRAGGVPVSVLAAAAGVSGESVRVVCRAHGPDPGGLGDPLAGDGWVRTPEAARLLEVGVARLEAHAAGAERAGISTILGWYRRWYAPSLPGWWAGSATPTRTRSSRELSRARAVRIRAAVRAGASWQSIATGEGVSVRTVGRDLRGAAEHELGPGG